MITMNNTITTARTQLDNMALAGVLTFVDVSTVIGVSTFVGVCIPAVD